VGWEQPEEGELAFFVLGEGGALVEQGRFEKLAAAEGGFDVGKVIVSVADFGEVVHDLLAFSSGELPGTIHHRAWGWGHKGFLVRHLDIVWGDMNTKKPVLVVVLAGVALVGGGCELFPPTPPPPVRAKGGPTELLSLGEGKLGAAGAYVVGVERGRLAKQGDLTRAALAASLAGETSPAVVGKEGVTSADLDGDGFITLDEVVALVRARLSDDEVAAKLLASGYVLEATRPQAEHLRTFGVGAKAIAVLVGAKR